MEPHITIRSNGIAWPSQFVQTTVSDKTHKNGLQMNIRKTFVLNFDIQTGCSFHHQYVSWMSSSHIQPSLFITLFFCTSPYPCNMIPFVNLLATCRLSLRRQTIQQHIPFSFIFLHFPFHFLQRFVEFCVFCIRFREHFIERACKPVDMNLCL